MSLLQKVLEGAVGADFFASLERTVVTVNLKRLSPNAVTSYWIATRLLSNGTINQIFQLQFPHQVDPTLKPLEAESMVFDQCSSIFDSHIMPLLQEAIQTEGFVAPLAELPHEQRAQLAIGHMGLHSRIQNLGNETSNLNVRTARQYQIAKSFGLGTAVAAIAAFESIEPTTVARRLTRTRDAGLIEKALKTTKGRERRKEGK
jgi:hypothetical protein